MYQAPEFSASKDVMTNGMRVFRELEELMSEEVRAGTIDGALAPSGQLCKEILMGVRVIAPKLQRALANP